MSKIIICYDETDEDDDNKNVDYHIRLINARFRMIDDSKEINNILIKYDTRDEIFFRS